MIDAKVREEAAEHESLRRDPFDENVWEDLVRVYVRSALPFVDV